MRGGSVFVQRGMNGVGTLGERALQATAGAADDDALAFTETYRRVGPRGYRLALAITGDAALAEDLLQEAFVRVWRRRARLRAPEALDGYLLAAVRHLACDHRRREETAGRALGQVRLLAARRVDGDEGPDPERVARAVARLPEAQREVVTLRVIEGLPAREVARCVGAPEGTVHSRLRYALDKLRDLLAVAPEARRD